MSNLPGWQAIENAIYHQLFAWPLLVLQNVGSESILGTAFSVPIGVDIEFNGRNEVIAKLDLGESLDTTQWKKELELCVEVAKELWRSKHGGVSFSFRETVRQAAVTFDFRLLNHMLHGLPFELQLTDRSMGSYLAQVVLHRLLGRSTALSSAVTGAIGERRIWPDGTSALDHVVAPAEFILEKMDYVFASRLFAKMVLPEASAGAYLNRSLGDPITEVNYCSFLSNVADAVQVSGWRQYIYIRCPDIMYAIHRRPEMLPSPNSVEVDRVRQFLAGNENPIVRLPEDVSLSALIAYLRHVNFIEREDLPSPKPPMLSWAFIRAVEDENDRRLWETIWRTIGASQEDFNRLCNAVTPSEVAARLAEALNIFSPRESCPSHRAPDLLVVCCAGRLEAAEWKRGTLAYRPHRFPAVIGALQDQPLLATPFEKMREYIGQTRIVVVQHGELDIGGEHPPPIKALPPNIAGVLTRLGIFRFGFTQRMASILLNELNFSGRDVREVLSSLREGQYLGESGGAYWVRGNIGVDASQTTISRLDLARWHWAAAKALAPYLSSDAAAGLNYSEALLPENVHEAMFHLEAAADAAVETRYAEPSGDTSVALEANGLRKAVRIAQARTYRFIALPTLSSVEYLTKDRQGLSSRAAWDLSKELMREKEELGVGIPPSELVAYARACHSWLEDLIRGGSPATQCETVAEQVATLFEQAWHASRGGTARDLENKFTTLTNYGYFIFILLEKGKVSEDFLERCRRTLNTIQKEMEELLNSDVASPAIEAKWFEVQGDAMDCPDQAGRHYRDGTVNAPFYYTCWVKLAGALRLQGMSIPEASKSVSEVPITIRHKLYPWAQNQANPVRSGLDRPWISDLWRSGLDVLAFVSKQ